MKILKFFSPTCGPCKVMSRNLGRVLSTLKEIEVQDIDITNDDNEPLLNRWNIRTVPTVIILDEKDELIKEFKGIVSTEAIEEVLDDWDAKI